MALIGGFNNDDFDNDFDDNSLLMGKRFNDVDDCKSYNGSLINSFDKNESNNFNLEILSNEESNKTKEKISIDILLNKLK